MSNVLKVSLQTTIYSLADRGWSQRRIASELGINRETVSGLCGWQNRPFRPPALRRARLQNQPFRSPALELGRRSYCEPLAEAIAAKVEVGLSARRIYQDLVEQNGFNDSYQSVQRLFASLRQPNHSGSGAWKLDLVRKCRWTSGWEPRFTMGRPLQAPTQRQNRTRSRPARFQPAHGAGSNPHQS